MKPSAKFPTDLYRLTLTQSKTLEPDSDTILWIGNGLFLCANGMANIDVLHLHDLSLSKSIEHDLGFLWSALKFDHSTSYLGFSAYVLAKFDNEKL